MVKDNRVLDQDGSSDHVSSNSGTVLLMPRSFVVESETRFKQCLCVLRDRGPFGLSVHGESGSRG